MFVVAYLGSSGTLARVLVKIGRHSEARIIRRLPGRNTSRRIEPQTVPLRVHTLRRDTGAMILFLLPLVWLDLVNAGCYEPNVAHPLPDYVTGDGGSDIELQVAFMAINNAITAAVTREEFANTSFSVDVTSSKKTLWSRHHTALQRNESRPDIPHVSGDALYRIASITKTFTVLGILYQHAAGNLSLDDPIDHYIDELVGEQNGTIPWKDITLRSLASQLSGIPRECKPRQRCRTVKGKVAEVLFSRPSGCN